MQKRNISFYKQLEQLTYSVYPNSKFPAPYGWVSVKKFENKKTGFYAEAFKSPEGEIFLVPRATQCFNGCGFDIMDFYNDLQLFRKQLPDQLNDLYDAYDKLVSIYGDNIKAAGYSLAGTEVAILGNDKGIETVTFEAYGVGDFVESKNTQNIINFGNEADPIFTLQLDNQLGNVYIIPANNDLKEKFTFGVGSHLPYSIGDISQAYEYKTILEGCIAQSHFDDSIFDYKNRVYYKGELLPLDEFEKEDIDVFWDQALSKEGLPVKEELEARSRMGELIYVESYVRSDGTKVSGYYRKCPR